MHHSKENSQNKNDFLQGHKLQAAGVAFCLHPQKAIFWADAPVILRNNEETYRTLILSDTHFGKAETFQQQGIPVPGGGTDHDLERLYSLIRELSVNLVIFLGDLFHSTENSSFSKVKEAFNTWRTSISHHLRMILVMGNHDIMHGESYRQLGLDCVNTLHAGPFLLTHEPRSSDDQPYIAGHLHPSCRIRGRARQTVTLPCFRVRNSSIIMPAFGSFTGSHTLTGSPGDQFYIVTPDSVICRSN